MHILLLVFLMTPLIGCGAQIEEFVKTAADAMPNNTPSIGSSNEAKIKISPGAKQLTGTQVNSYMAITTSKRTLVGNNVEAKITFHQKRQ